MTARPRPPSGRSRYSRRVPVRARVAVLAAALTSLLVAAFAAVPGSPFQPVLPPGAAPAGPFRWLGETLGFAALRGDAAAFVGAALLAVAAAAYVALLVAVLRGEVPLRAVVAFAVLTQLAVVALPLLFSRDVYSYAAYGRIVAVHGANPYLLTPLDVAGDPVVAYVGPKWIDTPSVYGPAWSSIAAGVAAIAATPAAMVGWFRAIAIVAGLATTLLLVPVARRVSPGREALAVALFGCNPVVVFHTIASGHNDILVALGIVGALGLVAIDRPTPAAVALAVAALVKAPAAVPLLLLLVWLAARAEPGARWRAVRAPLLASVAVGLVVAGPYLQTEDPTLGMRELASHEGWLAPSRFVARLLELVAPGLPLAAIARATFAFALVAGLVGVCVLVARRARDGVAALGAGWGWGLLLLMLLGPVLLPWYVAWALPVAWLLPRRPAVAVVGTSVALAVSLFATEPDRVAMAFRANLFLGHWVITPIVAALLVLAVRELRGGLRAAVPTPAGRVPAASGDPDRDRT